MAKTRIVSNSFTSGELDPSLHERYDFEPYSNGVKTLHNFLIKPQGGITRRWGSRFVAKSKNSSVRRIVPFVFSVTQSNVLELGNVYIRVFGQNGQITSGGVPVEIATPYTTSDLPDLHFTQDADSLIITHPRHQPRILARLSATSWQLRLFIPTPPPTSENGFLSATTFTLNATSGNNINAATGVPIFFESDIDRLISELPSLGNGLAIITDVINSSTVTLDIVSTFSKASYSNAEWRVQGSPVAQLAIEKGSPVGARTTLILQKVQTDAANLVLNGNFSAGLGSWINLSGPTVSTGNTTGGVSDTALIDTGATFQSDGVQVGYRAINNTTLLEDSVTAIISENEITTATGGATWNTNDSYTVRQTGTALLSGGTVTLNGGVNGIAHIEQGIPTVIGASYRLTFDVAGQPLSAQIGTTSGNDDVSSESTFDINNENEITFIATSTTSYIGFKNNQNVNAVLDNVSVTGLNVGGFRVEDVGKYIRANEGIIEITQIIDATTVIGIVRKELVDTLTALPGAWSLEETKWSDALGWPHTCTVFGDRLFFFATNTFPQGVWGSRIGVFPDFGTGVNDADALDFQISATQINIGEWIAGERVLLAGTQREEFSMRGSVGNTLTPTSIEVISPTSIGSNHTQPVRTDRTLIFTQRGGRRLREIVFSITADDRVANDLSIIAEHLTLNGIREIAFQQEPIPIIWVVTNDDKLLSLTYLLDHQVIGWAQHPTDGLVKSVAVIPHPDGDRDQVWLVVERGIGGSPYIEYLDDETGYYNTLMMDCGLTQTFSPATTTVSGLSHLNGKTVAVLGDGSAQPNKVVSGGSITLSEAAEEVEVGLPFTSKVVTLRPTINAQPFTGLKITSPRIFISLLNTLNAIINEERVTFSVGDGVMDEAVPLFTGLKEVSTVGWDFDNEITVEQDLPYPIHIRGIFYTLVTEDI